MAILTIFDPPSLTPSQELTLENLKLHNSSDATIIEVDGNNVNGDVLFWFFRLKQGWRWGRIGKRGRIYYHPEAYS